MDESDGCEGQLRVIEMRGSGGDGGSNSGMTRVIEDKDRSKQE